MSFQYNTMSSELFRPYSCMNNPAQEKARVICYKFTSALSILSNIYALSIIYNKWRQRKSNIDPYQRIMVGVNTYGLSFTAAWFTGSWMAPSESNWWGASGNAETCTAQGFFIWFGIFGNVSELGVELSSLVTCTDVPTLPAQVLYSLLLSGQMLLLVTFGWSERKFERTIERRAHVVLFLFCFLAGFAPIFFNGYNGECGRCCIMPMPMWCGDWFWGDGSECVRGSPMLAQVYWGFVFVAFPLVTLFVTAAMFTVYRTVRNQERRTNIYRFDADTHFRESLRIRKTMLLYTSSFYVCWVIPLIFLWAHPEPQPHPPLNVLGELLFPLQGVFDMCVFIQPRCVKYQRENSGSSLFSAYFHVILNTGSLRKFARMLGRTVDTSSTNSDGSTEVANDGIGFGTYNEDNLDDTFVLRQSYLTSQIGTEGIAEDVEMKANEDHGRGENAGTREKGRRCSENDGLDQKDKKKWNRWNGRPTL
ncbi:hypothetical protein ACHAWF_005302 [Thalassiosira exigua]